MYLLDPTPSVLDLPKLKVSSRVFIQPPTESTCLPSCRWLYINIPNIKEITTPDIACCLQTAGYCKHLLCIEWDDHCTACLAPFSHTFSKWLKTQQLLLFGLFTLMMLFWWQNRWRDLTLKPHLCLLPAVDHGQSP